MDTFREGFTYEAVVEGGEVREFKKVVVGGMGGSELPASLYQRLRPHVDLRTHRSYGLPVLPDDVVQDTLYIASSYSGDTEETLSFFDEALERGLNLAVIASGGELLRKAEEVGVPYVGLPEGLMPRYAIGYSLCALATLLSDEALTLALSQAASTEPLHTGEGAKIASWIGDTTPLVVSASGEGIISYIWKIFLNETAKDAAFSNVIPEFNHNEIEMFEGDRTNFSVIFLPPLEPQEQIEMRMHLTQEILESRDISVQTVSPMGSGIIEKMLNIVQLGVSVAEEHAAIKGVDPEKIEMIEEFKAQLAAKES